MCDFKFLCEQYGTKKDKGVEICQIVMFFTATPNYPILSPII